jgi:hypothetical protein
VSSYKKDTLRPPRTPAFGVPKPHNVKIAASNKSVGSLGASSSYAKAALGATPNAFSGDSFGDTALQQTPSIVGMGNAK